MYDRILLPTDGSQGTEAAVKHALSFAGRYGAALDVLYVVDASSLPVDVRAGAILEAMETDGRRAVDEVVERARAADVEATGEVVEGTPHRAVLDRAEAGECDLIVMGTHGRTGFDRLLLGSVTARVVRLSPVPVVTVPMASEEG